jgi:hypothetical protein
MSESTITGAGTGSVTAEPSSQHEHVFPLDIEHGGIRLALPVLTVIGFVVGYVGSSAVIDTMKLDASAGCISFFVGGLVAVITSLLADRFLKRIWPSKRTLALNPERVRLQDQRKNREDVQIDWGGDLSMLAWRFEVSRRSSRIPKGWYMLGIQLTQGETDLTLYTFMSPKDAELLPTYRRFVPLQSRAAINKGQGTLREISEQRRLLKAEDARWMDGAEVRREDFAILLESISRYANLNTGG